MQADRYGSGEMLDLPVFSAVALPFATFTRGRLTNLSDKPRGKARVRSNHVARPGPPSPTAHSHATQEGLFCPLIRRGGERMRESLRSARAMPFFLENPRSRNPLFRPDPSGFYRSTVTLLAYLRKCRSADESDLNSEPNGAPFLIYLTQISDCPTRRRPSQERNHDS